MIYIEFVGIPGSGKSSIVDALVKKMQQDCSGNFLTSEEAFCQVSRLKIDKCYRWLLKSLPQKAALYFSRKLINRSYMQHSAQNRFLAEFGRSFSTYLSSEECRTAPSNSRLNSIQFYLETGSIFKEVSDSLDNTNIVFFSEGFAQKSFMFLNPGKRNNVEENLLNAYLSNIPYPNILVHIKTPPEVCFTRMNQRSKGLPLRLKGAEDKDVLNYLKSSDAHLSKVTRLLEQKYHVKTIEITNTSSFKETISNSYILLRDYFNF